ncbi:MAG TPA: hypothetical protein VF170_20560, partial [Planctomycetaceae bacterium]
VLVNSQIVLDRLKMVLDLTSKEERKQYDALKDFVEVFLFGVDVRKPVRMDVLTGGPVTMYRLDVPVDNFKDFWQLNLKPLGIPVQGFARQPGLYKLGGNPGAAFNGFMLYDPKKRGGYATIVEDAQHLPPTNGPVPTQEVQHLLSAGYDAALQLQNRPGGVEERRAHFEKEREQILGQLKRDADESVSDFNLRKFVAGLQFDESKRLYAEAKELVAGLTVSPNPAKGTAKLRIEPLPDTSLAESVSILGQQPSRFAGVPRDENAATSGRIHFPLDEFRKKNLLALSQKIRENELEETATEEGPTPEQKEAGKEFINSLFDRIDEGLNQGVIDGFVEMTKGQDGLYTVVGGLKSADGTKWVPVIELLPKTPRASNVKTNVGEHAGVQFHELTLSKEEHPDFHELFGGGRLLAGTGPDAIWYAAGPNAEEALKRAIDQAAQPGQPDPAVVSFRGELLPWVRILDQRLGTRGQDKYRDMAIQAFRQGDGRLTLEVARNGDAVDAEMTLDGGVLRFIGKALADFSAENLAE